MNVESVLMDIKGSGLTTILEYNSSVLGKFLFDLNISIKRLSSVNLTNLSKMYHLNTLDLYIRQQRNELSGRFYTEKYTRSCTSNIFDSVFSFSPNASYREVGENT